MTKSPAPCVTPLKPAAFWTFIGNYGPSEPRGIALACFDPAEPALTNAGLAAPAHDPNFLVVHPCAPFLYAVTSTKVADYCGAVEAFAIDRRTGQLTFLNRQPSGGDNPAHLAVDPTGQMLLVANYSGATIAAFPLTADGRISPPTQIIHHQGSSIHPKRQTKPYPHGITFDPSGRTILVPDLGTDQIFRYQVDVTKGTLLPTGAASVAPGSGPRHVAMARGANFFYIINELTPSLCVFSYSSTGPMTEIQHLAPWPQDEAYAGAEIEVHPNGRFLYASNRGHDTIAICAIDQHSGKLTLLGLQPTAGKTPRHFALDPSANFLLVSNMDSNAILLFRVDPHSGRLTPCHAQTPTEAPCCLAFVPVTS